MHGYSTTDRRVEKVPIQLMQHSEEIHDDQGTHYDRAHLLINGCTEFDRRLALFPIACSDGKNGTYHGGMYEHFKKNVIWHKGKSLKPERETGEEKKTEGKNRSWKKQKK